MRTLKSMLAGAGFQDEDLNGPPGTNAAANPQRPQDGQQIGTAPLGISTGAPPWVRFRTYLVTPNAAIAQNSGPTLVVPGDRASRLVSFTAPLVGFSIFVGDSGVRADPGGSGLALPPGLTYQIPIPGNQEIYAVTDSPVFLPLRVQIGPLLVGDRERMY